MAKVDRVKTVVYMTAEHKQKITEAAAKEGVSLSTYVAQAAINKAKRRDKNEQRSTGN